MSFRVGIVACLLALAGGAFAAWRVPVSVSSPPTRAAPPEWVVPMAPPGVPREPDPLAPPGNSLAAVEPSTAPTDDVPELRAASIGLEDGLVISGESTQRVLLFTFDDGPERRTTPDLLDALDRHGVKAVFFVTADRLEGPGNRIHEQRELLQEIVRRGHTVGNHTVTHRQLPLLSTEEVNLELDTADRVLTDLVGLRPRLFRAPGGSRSPRVDRILADRGYTHMLWSHGTGDFQVAEPDEVVRIFRRILDRREREEGVKGGVVLMHDTHPWSVAAFPRVMDEVQRRNCELLARGEELYDVLDDPAYFYQRRGHAEPGQRAPSLTLPPSVHAERQARLRSSTEQRCDATLATR